MPTPSSLACAEIRQKSARQPDIALIRSDRAAHRHVLRAALLTRAARSAAQPTDMKSEKVMQPPKYLDEMLPWNDRLQMLQCISAIEEAPDVMTFSFKATDDNWFRYAPGQFITLELPIERADEEGPLLRTYTLSST